MKMRLLLFFIVMSVCVAVPDYGNPYPFVNHCIKCHTFCSLNLTAKHKPANDLSFVGKRLHPEQIRVKLTKSKHERFKGDKKELDTLIKWLYLIKN